MENCDIATNIVALLLSSLNDNLRIVVVNTNDRDFTALTHNHMGVSNDVAAIHIDKVFPQAADNSRIAFERTIVNTDLVINVETLLLVIIHQIIQELLLDLSTQLLVGVSGLCVVRIQYNDLYLIHTDNHTNTIVQQLDHR